MVAMLPAHGAAAVCAMSVDGIIAPVNSTEISVLTEAFIAPSLGVVALTIGGAQDNERQTPPVQSLAAVHASPVVQSGQLPPPQSTSLSVPLVMPSVQLASWHLPARQMPLAHCTPALHSMHFPFPSQKLPPS